MGPKFLSFFQIQEMSTIPTNLVTEILDMNAAAKKKSVKKTPAAVKSEVKIINISPIKKASKAQPAKAKVISTARIVKTLKYLTDKSLGKLVPDIGETADVVLLALQEAVASRAVQKGPVKVDVVPANGECSL